VAIRIRRDARHHRRAASGIWELAAAKRRIRQLETELAVSRKVNEIFLDQDLAPKASSR
jgi:hypothetical protein